MSDIGTAYVNIVPKAEGIKGQVTNMMNGATGPAGESSGKLFGLKMKAAIGAAAIGTAVVTGLKKSISEGAKLEQSLGGIETLFKKSADTVIKNARQAYKTAGISANEYMENVTSFSAGLIKSMGGDTKKAAKVADTAMKDMSDNANKMGTDMGSIQNAYQGFAKQNYTMLDNLKLGYGGTKTEMERLLKDAQEITGVKYDISNLGDVYSAIHVIQKELGITGTTAKEAEHTLSGSFGSMKAAFTDLMGNLAMGENVGQAMKALVESAVTFLAGNLIPAIGRIFLSLPEAISAGFQAVSAYIPNDIMGVVDTILNAISAAMPVMLLKGTGMVVSIGKGLIAGLPGAITQLAQLITKLANFVSQNYPLIVSAGLKLIKGLGDAIIKNGPAILKAVGVLVQAIFKAFLKLAPLSLTAGVSIMKALGSGIASMIGWLVGKAKAGVDKILAPIKGVVAKVKGFFPINIGKIFSNLKLPHFNVSGGKAPWGIAGKGSMPKFSVQWYAKGGLVTEPTLFAGVGEKGTEAILPLDPFWKKLDKLAENKGGDITINVYGTEGQSPKEMAEEVKRMLIRETKQRRLAW